LRMPSNRNRQYFGVHLLKSCSNMPISPNAMRSIVCHVNAGPSFLAFTFFRLIPRFQKNPWWIL
jgi:hypothetical protein